MFIYSIRFLASRDRQLDIKAVLRRRSRRWFSATTVLIERSAVGQAGLGYLVDLGRAADIGVCPVADLHGDISMLRRLMESPEQRARLSAVFGILGAVDVPIVYMSNRWWRTQHPQPVIGGGEGLDWIHR